MIHCISYILKNLQYFEGLPQDHGSNGECWLHPDCSKLTNHDCDCYLKNHCKYLNHHHHNDYHNDYHDHRGQHDDDHHIVA